VGQGTSRFDTVYDVLCFSFGIPATSTDTEKSYRNGAGEQILLISEAVMVVREVIALS
jgi:hypothetical protein